MQVAPLGDCHFGGRSVGPVISCNPSLFSDVRLGLAGGSTEVVDSGPDLVGACRYALINRRLVLLRRSYMRAIRMLQRMTELNPGHQGSGQLFAQNSNPPAFVVPDHAGPIDIIFVRIIPIE